MEHPSKINSNEDSFIIKGKTLTFDSLSVHYKNKTLLCSEIDKIKYGTMQLYINGVKANKSYQVILKDKSGKELKIIFQRLWLNTKKPEILYQDIIAALWKHITSRIVNDMIKDLKKGQTVEVGNVAVNKNGITIKVWSWLKFKKEALFIPWKLCRKQTHNGLLLVYSEERKRKKCSQSFLRVWNLSCLHSLLNYLWEDGRCYQLERGELD